MVNISKPSIGKPEGGNNKAAPGWITRVERDVMEDANLSCGARVTYAILCGYEGQNCKIPFPGLKTLARKLGCGRETVQRYISELRKAGLVERVKRREKGKFLTNGYPILRPSRRMANGSAVAGETEADKHRSGNNQLREMLLQRNTKEKESQFNKESQCVKEEGASLGQLGNALLSGNQERANDILWNIVFQQPKDSHHTNDQRGRTQTTFHSTT
jgi:biotin operon repressor